MCAAAGLSFFLIFFGRGARELMVGWWRTPTPSPRSPVQRERLVDLAAERVRALRELQGPPERILDQQSDLAQTEQRSRREADDDGQNDGRHRRREAER